MANIQVHEKAFKLFISKEEIAKQVNRIAAEIDQNYENEIPLFIAILNGSFIFASDLIRSVNITAEISFVKVSSYEGTAVGNMNKLIGLNTDIKDRSIIILEDIVDTGNTLNKIMPYLKEQQPKSIEIASLLSKPDAIKYPIEVAYNCFDIPNNFVVGYGLDYDGLGRQYADIYQTI